MYRVFSRLYEKNELNFSLVWIGIYCLFNSLGNQASDAMGVPGVLTLILNLLLCAGIFLWVRSKGLMEKYGLRGSKVAASRFLWYIPLGIFVSHNFWGGVDFRHPLGEILIHSLNMLCVGFLEEVIFRGFLFRALEKDNVRTAIIISSITFGIGHILNLFNGSGMTLAENLCQVVGAIACGFLFVVIFHRGGSLLPCILAHGLNNGVSIFALEVQSVPVRLLLLGGCMVVVVAYTLILRKTIPENEEKP